MPNIWLRLYHDMPNDPKWRTIARASKQTIPVVLSVYVHLLTIASAEAERGTVPNVNSEDLASALDIDSEAVDAVLVAMQGRVLEGDKLSGWDKRQTNREDSSTERVKRWREKKVKPDVTHGNALKRTVTQMKPDVTADKKREEEIKKKQVPSRDKREANPMHVVFKGLVEDAWKEWGNPLDMPWDGAEGKQLGMLIGANPKLGPDGMRRLLQYRARSTGVNLAERPSKWLRSLTDYARGPLNEFKQPQEMGNGTTQGNHKSNAAVDRQRISHDAILEAGRRRYGFGAVEDDGRGSGGQAQPDPASGDAGCVPTGMGGDSPEIRLDDFQGRTLEGTP